MRQWFESEVRQLSDVEYSTLLNFMAALLRLAAVSHLRRLSALSIY
jgi:hypothetical protein